MSSDKVDPSSGQFVDPLFAVMIAAAVAETVVKWVNSSTAPGIFQICVIAVGFTNILLSWFGYHKSVHKRPIKGSLRFMVTVALLPLYLLTIILYEKAFAFTALVYAMIFFLWSFWEYLKFIEHKKPHGFWRLQRRPYNVCIYVVFSYYWLLAPWLAPYQHSWLVSNVDSIAITLIALSILSLRIIKSANRPETPASKIKEEIYNLLFGSPEQDA